MKIVGKFVEMMSWRMRRRAVRKALASLRKHLSQLSEPGHDIDMIGVLIYQDVANIELHSRGEAIGPGIWV